MIRETIILDKDHDINRRISKDISGYFMKDILEKANDFIEENIDKSSFITYDICNLEFDTLDEAIQIVDYCRLSIFGKNEYKKALNFIIDRAKAFYLVCGSLTGLALTDMIPKHKSPEEWQKIYLSEIDQEKNNVHLHEGNK